MSAVVHPLLENVEARLCKDNVALCMRMLGVRFNLGTLHALSIADQSVISQIVGDAAMAYRAAGDTNRPPDLTCDVKRT